MSYKDYIPQIFREKEKWGKLAKIVDIEIEKINETLADVEKALFVDTAEGQDLDRIAKIFNLVRKDGEDDESFRMRIKSYYQSVMKSGTVDDIKEYFTNLFDLTVNVGDEDKAIFNIKFEDSATSEQIKVIRENVGNVRAAGTFYTLELNVYWDDVLQFVESFGVEGIEEQPFVIENVNIVEEFKTFNYGNVFILGYSNLESGDVVY
jgi:hypothetical protein